jgi:hypothetical protein
MEEKKYDFVKLGCNICKQHSKLWICLHCDWYANGNCNNADSFVCLNCIKKCPKCLSYMCTNCIYSYHNTDHECEFEE